MKKVFLNFLIICCVFNAAKGQWVLQTSGTTNALRSVYFIDDNTGWTVGSNGTILKTSNGGTNWVNLSYLTNVFYQGVRFVNQSTGWCVGDSGVIINTTNGGTNWYTQNSGTINELYSVFFINTNTGWVVGNYNTILKTTNMGSNWVSQTGVSNTEIWSVFFIDVNTGWVACGGKIMKTTNGGIDWLNKTTAPRIWYSIFFVNHDTGWIVGYSFSRSKSINGGETWIYPADNVFLGNNNAEDSPPGSNTCIYFINQNTGWITGSQALGGGAIIKTTNTGTSWFYDYSWTRHRALHSIFLDSSGNGCAVGAAGTILRNTVITGLKQVNNEISSKYSLYQNYPNPFNPTTKIKFSIPQLPLTKGAGGMNVLLIIYDILGREVATLVNEKLQPGTYEVEFDGSNFASGVYFYKLIAGNYTDTQKMILLK